MRDNMQTRMVHPHLPALLLRLPFEIRLCIFEYAFTPEHAREVITVSRPRKRSSSSSSSSSSCSSPPFRKLDFQFKYTSEKESLHERIKEFEHSKLFLRPGLNGVTEVLAQEAAEVLFKSRFVFEVHANHLSEFLYKCPLSGLKKPGRYITRLSLCVNEDVRFIGDGKQGHDLRIADWVDLHGDVERVRETRANKHKLLMRRCWREILRLPKLKNFECRIMPSCGRLELSKIHACEIRDMLPSLFRLFNKPEGVTVELYLRTWEKITTASPLPFGKNPDPFDPSTYESPYSLMDLLPFGYGHVKVPVGSIPVVNFKAISLETLPFSSNPFLNRYLEPHRARYRAYLYHALDTLFLRLWASQDYVLVHSDFIKKAHRPSDHRAKKSKLGSSLSETRGFLCFEGLAAKLLRSASSVHQRDELMVESRKMMVPALCGCRGPERVKSLKRK